MKQTTLDAIRDHAIRVYPRECCGLVVIVLGRERYIECRNTASGTDSFILPADEYAAAEESGAITAIVHSHPDASGEPSEADRVACEASGLPWHIAEVRCNDSGERVVTRMTMIEPSGYAAPLVGRSFAHGVLDCYTLVRDWYRIERGVTLPNFQRTGNWWNAGEDLYVENYARAGFRALREGEEIAPGDVILMQVRAPVVNHAAVYLGDGLMLHHLYGRLSSRDVYGGYWLEHTRVVLRFEP
ncbi:C40 family peptidase [Paraburkholderia bonniea]|uniref:C40 family peptidase n=1 Tax=Paraburkholderia bonniea TaxID=2152891 RepID=UPI0012926B13|nr:C40 family peptidase [Paraburkholderia bonniea]WJF92008.1 C40 family peptidase [Paraburkholderia bonniea]WJF95327.1 C40 family peptidase [Paraburkholderia bonniea]